MEQVATLEELLSELEARVGEPLNAATFGSRLAIQKAVHLFQAQGHELDEGRFSYGTHHHGPYSPALAREYYGEDDEPDLDLGPRPSPGALNIPDEDIETIADALERDSEFLEAASTLLQIARPREPTSLENLYPTLSRIKPHLEEDTIREAWTFLTRRELVQST